MAEQVEYGVFMASSLKTVAYLRVSTIGQDTGNQRPGLLEFACRDRRVRLGRSIGRFLEMLDILMKREIRIDGEQDIRSKVMTTFFALFAEVELDLVSERTWEGLGKVKASHRLPGQIQAGWP